MANAELNPFDEFILTKTPSISYLISKDGEIKRSFFGGYSLLEPQKIKTRSDTLYDLASLTKVFSTTLIALKSYQNGTFDINKKYSASSNPFTPLDLLRHEAGFPSWYPLYKFSSKEEVYDFLLNKMERKNVAEEAIYSCLGYILLGFILEEELNDSLSNLFFKLIANPPGITNDAMFNPPSSLKDKIAGSELKGDYEREMALKEGCNKYPSVGDDGLWGVVSDGNARFLGGVAGNAGLFANLRGSFELSKVFLDTSFLDKKVLKLCFEKGRAKSGEKRSAGFKMASEDSPVSRELKRGSVYHEGFTGTFVSINEDGEILIMLTNRIHPVHPKVPFSNERVKFIQFCRKILNG